MLKRTLHNMKPGRVQILLGLSLGSLLGIAAICSAAGEAWTSKADMPTPRSGLSTVVVNGRIYAIGGTEMQMPGQGDRQVFGSSLVEEYDPAQNVWTEKADMLTPGTNISICIVNGKIYVLGGADGMMRRSSTLEEYDPAADTWEQKADMLTPRSGASIAAVDGKIYAIGGMGMVEMQADEAGMGRTALSTVEEYDPLKDSWEQKADMPTPRSGLSTVVVNGRIYAIGGMGMVEMQADEVGMGRTALSTVEEYDPSTDTWAQKTDMPTPRLTPSVVVVGRKIYVIGGTEGMMEASSIVEEYDPARDNWSEKTSIPTPRTGPAVTAANRKIYVIGGAEAKAAGVGIRQGAALSTVEEYDPARDDWEQMEDMPTARCDLAASAVKGKIYAIGGTEAQAAGVFMGQGTALSTVEEYMPEDWSPSAVYPRGKLTTSWGAIKRGK